jgi:dipeptide transport system substrate-binding protein
LARISVIRVCLALLATCVAGRFGAAQADTLVVCTEAAPDFLNAQLSTTSFDVSEQVSDRLVEIEPGGSAVRPALAESWTVSPDGLRYVFKLRHGVKFQSNARFTPTRDLNADDVVFSFRRMFDAADPFYKIANGNFPEFVDLLAPDLLSVSKVGDDMVAFTLKAPNAALVPALSIPPFSILSAEYAAALEKAGKPDALDTELIGTGPFQLVQYQKDTLVRFRTFKDFWGAAGAQAGRAAKVDNLVFVITPNPSVRYAKLRTNECQIARYPNPSDLPAIRANPALRLQSADTTTISYIFFRTDRKPFDDKRVRQALAMAIDMPDLVADVFQGGGQAAAALIPPALWGHDAALQPYPHDPAKAKQLLSEAGYPKGFNTDLWAIPVVRPYMPNGRRAAEMIQADWAKIGVKAQIVTYEWGEYLRRIRDGDAPVGMLGEIWDYPDPSEIMLSFLCGAPANAPHYCSGVYDQAVRAASLTTDHDMRVRLYQQAQQAMYDDVPLVPMADVRAYVALRKNVQGFRPSVLGSQPYGGVSLGR